MQAHLLPPTHPPAVFDPTRTYRYSLYDQYIRFAPESRPWIDLAPWIPLAAYHWASVFILVGFAMTFVRGEIRGALLTIPILSGILWLIGWLQVPWLLIGAVLVIGVLVYMRMGESDLGF